MITDLLVAALGYVLAALSLGLWWGERGRRKDAQRREGVIQVDHPKPAVVRQSEEGEGPVPADTRAELEIAKAREKYIEDCVREGFDPQAAAEDFDRIMARMWSDQSAML